MTPAKISPWTPTTDLKTLRRMGKLGEEAAELLAVSNRVIIQGIDEVDPSSGKVNRERLLEELADVQAQIHCTRRWMALSPEDFVRYQSRVETKIDYMRQWEDMVEPVSVICPRCGTDRSKSECPRPFVNCALIGEAE